MPKNSNSHTLLKFCVLTAKKSGVFICQAGQLTLSCEYSVSIFLIKLLQGEIIGWQNILIRGISNFQYCSFFREPIHTNCQSSMNCVLNHEKEKFASKLVREIHQNSPRFMTCLQPQPTLTWFHKPKLTTF